MQGRSLNGKTVAEVKAKLQECISDVFKPTLAIVFCSISQNRQAISEMLDEAGLKIFGVTSNGEFIDETPEKLSTAILLLDVNPAYFKILCAGYPENNYQEIAKGLAIEATTHFQHPSFLIAGSHIETDAEALLRGFTEATSPEVNIYGCMAGDDITFTQQFVFTNNWESNKGLLVLALNEEKILIKGRATCGWNAVGTVKTVTKSEGTHVYTVDDVPVLDLTAKYGGIENLSPDNPDLLIEIGAHLPLQLVREKGDPIMRPGLLIDWTDHSFYCSGIVPQGSKVRFSLPPDFDVINKVIYATNQLKETEMPEADAVIVFNCAGRLLSFGPMVSQELDGIKKVWNVPMVGMFSNAELARATGGELEMHNLTTCVVALKEK